MHIITPCLDVPICQYLNVQWRPTPPAAQDRIASLNGRSVDLVLRQQRAAFVRLIGMSVLQSAASAVLAPSLRHVADVLALRWRQQLTRRAHNTYLQVSLIKACNCLQSSFDHVGAKRWG